MVVKLIVGVGQRLFVVSKTNGRRHREPDEASRIG
jgi:hypothetical protein